MERTESITVNGAYVEFECVRVGTVEFVTATVDGILLGAFANTEAPYPLLSASELAMSCVAARLEQRHRVAGSHRAA